MELCCECKEKNGAARPSLIQYFSFQVANWIGVSFDG